MFDLERFLSGDRKYVTEIIREHSPLVLVICQSYSRDYDQAQDLHQETWKVVCQKVESFRGTGSFRSWLRTVTHNVCLSELRTTKSTLEGLERFAAEEVGLGRSWSQIDPLADTSKRQLHRAILRAIQKLTDGERDALTLRVIEEKTTAEAAEIMGVKPATVRSHLRHALTRLKEMTEDPDNELSRYRTNC